MTEPLRLLLVAADSDHLRRLTSLLGGTGPEAVELTHVGHVRDALRRLHHESFSAVLLDLSPPDPAGLDTLTRVHARVPGIPIIVLGDHADETLALGAIRAGAQDYLVKGQGDGALFRRAIRYAIERKRGEERLVYLAGHDPVTGLANRTLFREHLTRALLRADRSDRPVALLVLDLDRFRIVNDTFGPDAGDLLLRAVAGRLTDCLRTVDRVARLGSDEFAIILENIGGARDAARAAQRLLSTMTPPFLLDGHEVFVTPSIGIAIYPSCGTDASVLIKHADTAMSHAKDQGGNAFQFHTREMNAQMYERLTLERSLRHALEHEEFLLYYQPQVDLDSGQIIGAEALLRWRHPERGLVLPGEFIPVAEESGLIIPMGEWVLHQACVQVRAWEAEGLPLVRVAVNVSARQFQHTPLADTVARTLEDTGVEARYLEIELTESLLVENSPVSHATLERLKALGLQISIDDFGTGYCSLSYLKRFPIGALKIDKSFVSGITADPGDAAIVTAIIALAHSLGLKVIAEGVETNDQLDFLRRQGCDAAQGYLFCAPVRAEVFARVLAEEPGQSAGAWSPADDPWRSRSKLALNG
jgi:diguanylate cyclase (GGDEF)-like protein